MASQNSNAPLKEDEAAKFIGMSVSYLRLSRMRGCDQVHRCAAVRSDRQSDLVSPA